MTVSWLRSGWLPTLTATGASEHIQAQPLLGHGTGRTATELADVFMAVDQLVLRMRVLWWTRVYVMLDMLVVQLADLLRVLLLRTCIPK